MRPVGRRSAAYHEFGSVGYPPLSNSVFVSCPTTNVLLVNACVSPIWSQWQCERITKSMSSGVAPPCASDPKQ